MKLSIKTALLVFTLFFVSVQLFAQDTFDLKFKFEKGKTYFYRTSMTMDQTQNMMGQEMSTNTESKTKVRFDVTDVTPTQIELVTSIDSLYSKTGNPMGGEDIVSNGEGIVGKKTKMVYDVYGKKIKKIEVDAIQAAGNAGLSGGNTSSLMYQLAEKPVKIGDTWAVSNQDTIKVGEDGKMITKADVTYKVDSKESGSDLVKVTFTGTTKVEGAMSQGGFNIVLEGTGKTTGSFLFDVVKGVMTTSDNVVNMDMTAAIPDQSITIPITQKMQSKTVLSDK